MKKNTKNNIKENLEIPLSSETNSEINDNYIKLIKHCSNFNKKYLKDIKKIIIVYDDCPCCAGENTLKMTFHNHYNRHIHANCINCKMNFFS